MLDFNPGGMGPPLSYPPNYQRPEPAPLTREEIDRERYQRENRFATVRVAEIAIEVDGQTCLSRFSPQHKTVIDVPVRRLNELLNGRRIDLGDGNAILLRFAEASERVS